MRKRDTMFCGYEVTAVRENKTKLRATTKRILRKLKKDGVAIYQYDDSKEGVFSCDQIIAIADSIGLITYSSPYYLVVIDNKTPGRNFSVQQAEDENE
jgi:hypothetical protein